MYHQTSKISWLDVKNEKYYISDIIFLYQRFITHETTIANGAGRINLDFTDIMIKDWDGWTKLISINKNRMRREDWRLVNSLVNLQSALYTSQYELLPTYPEHPEELVGFHGSIKHRFLLKNPDEITPDDYVRIKGIPDHRDQEIFQVHVGASPSCPPFAYSLTTQSGFATVNGFHVYTQNAKTLDGWI